MGKILKIISGIPLFSSLSEDQLKAIQRIAIDKQFVKGESLITEGDKGSGFFIIISGQVKIYKVSAEGKEQILHIYGPGQPFGEVPVFAGQRFPANAMALSKMRVLFLPRKAFFKLIEDNPTLALKMLAVMSAKLREFTIQIENLSLKEIPARLATYLIYLSEEQGNHNFVDLTISKGQLASLLGTIPETLSRIFAKLTSQNLIRVEGRKIHLLDHQTLEDLAESGRESG